MSSLVLWVPVSIACKHLKVSPQRVYELLKGGRLRGRVLGNTTLVSMVSIDERLRVLGKGGEVDVSDR